MGRRGDAGREGDGPLDLVTRGCGTGLACTALVLGGTRATLSVGRGSPGRGGGVEFGGRCGWRGPELSAFGSLAQGPRSPHPPFRSSSVSPDWPCNLVQSAPL